jgi:hypothetical protein
LGIKLKTQKCSNEIEENENESVYEKDKENGKYFVSSLQKRWIWDCSSLD